MNDSFLKTGSKYAWNAPETARNLKFIVVGSVFHDGLEFYQIHGVDNDYVGEISRQFIFEHYKNLVLIAFPSREKRKEQFNWS